VTPEMHSEVQDFVTKWRVNATLGKNEMIMMALKHPVVFSITPCIEGEAPLVLDAHDAQWL
jgi:hypothetical protein